MLCCSHCYGRSGGNRLPFGGPSCRERDDAARGALRTPERVCRRPARSYSSGPLSVPMFQLNPAVTRPSPAPLARTRATLIHPLWPGYVSRDLGRPSMAAPATTYLSLLCGYKIARPSPLSRSDHTPLPPLLPLCLPRCPEKRSGVRLFELRSSSRRHTPASPPPPSPSQPAITPPPARRPRRHPRPALPYRHPPSAPTSPRRALRGNGGDEPCQSTRPRWYSESPPPSPSVLPGCGLSPRPHRGHGHASPRPRSTGGSRAPCLPCVLARRRRRGSCPRRWSCLPGRGTPPLLRPRCLPAPRPSSRRRPAIPETLPCVSWK